MSNLIRKFSSFKHPLKKGQQIRSQVTERFKETFVTPTKISDDGEIVEKIEKKVSDFVDVQEYDSEFHQPGLRAGEKPVPCSPYLYPFTVKNLLFSDLDSIILILKKHLKNNIVFFIF